jgi:hypothetical protein
VKHLRGIQQLTFSTNLNHAVFDAFLRPIVTQPKVVKKAKKTIKRKIESNDETAATAQARLLAKFHTIQQSTLRVSATPTLLDTRPSAPAVAGYRFWIRDLVSPLRSACAVLSS